MRLTHAIVTPEAAILTRQRDGGWQPVYAGRVDDRFVRIGLERPAATQHFVEQGLKDVLAGGAVQPDSGTPVGCAILTRKSAEK